MGRFPPESCKMADCKMVEVRQLSLPLLFIPTSSHSLCCVSLLQIKELLKTFQSLCLSNAILIHYNQVTSHLLSKESAINLLNCEIEPFQFPFLFILIFHFIFLFSSIFLLLPIVCYFCFNAQYNKCCNASA